MPNSLARPVYAPDDDVNIIIDGELTESEWMTAQVYQDFSVISPDTLNPPLKNRDVRVLHPSEGCTSVPHGASKERICGAPQQP